MKSIKDMTQEEIIAMMSVPPPIDINEPIEINPLVKIKRLSEYGKRNIDNGRYDEAIADFKEGLEIAEKHTGTDLERCNVATFCGNLARAYGDKGDLSNKLLFLKREIGIREKDDPGSLNLAIAYGNIAILYRDSSRFNLALESYQKYLEIKQKILPQNHPDLIYGFYITAKVAKNLKKYDLALSYVETSIQKDRDYKYSHHLKGLILYEQSLSLPDQEKKDALEQSLASYKKALELDPSYGDAKVDKLKTETLLLELEKDKFKKASRIQALRLEVSAAQTERPKDNSYDQTKRIKYQQAFKDVKIELPEAEFEIGSPRYKKALDNVLEKVSQLETRASVTEARVDIVEARVSSLEARMNILEKKVYNLSDVMAMVDETMSDVKRRIEQEELRQSSSQALPSQHKVSTGSSKLEDLLQERKKLEERQQHIKRFNQNDDLRHFYFALISELVAAYIAVKAMQSDKFLTNKSSKFTTPTKYVATVISLAPIAGRLVAGLIAGAGRALDTYQTAKTNEEFLRIGNIAASVEDFDKFTLRVSVDLTLAYETEILALQGKKVPEDWKKHVKSLLKGGLEKAMIEFLKDNETEAKLRGRVVGQKTISYLQQEGVAEGLRYEDALDIGLPTFKTSHSVAAMKVVNKITNPDPVDEPSKSVSKASAINKSRCVIL